MCLNSRKRSVETPNSFQMDRRPDTMSFIYEMATPPRNTSRNNSKTCQQETKHDRAKRRQDEWSHDAQPPATSSYFPSLELTGGSNKKAKAKNTQEIASASQEDIVPCSIDMASIGSPRVQRFSNRLMDKSVRGGGEAGGSKDSIQFTIRLLDVNIHENKKRIEEIKEQRGVLTNRVKELNDLIHHNDIDIRAAERANMQMETQKERLHSHLFAHAYRD